MSTSSYEPSPELTKAVLAGILAPLPYVAGVLAKSVPYKETAVGKALQHVVPTSLRAIASTQSAGARLALTRHGELTEEAKQSIVRRIAGWFVPSEVQDVTKALQQDIVRLGRDGFGEDAWTLKAEEGEIVLVVLNTSFLRVSADTVADRFMDSFERLKIFKDKLPFPKPAEALGRAKSVASRLAGVPAERDIVRAVLAGLAEGPALDIRATGEEPAPVVASVEGLQQRLAEALRRLGETSPARDCLAIMGAACRDLLALPGLARGEHAPQELVAALGRLRQAFGWQIALLGDLYDVEIDERLAPILPPEAG
jgi:hypothetical protein